MKSYTTYNEAIDDLLLSLRSVACSYSEKELSQRTIEQINRVKELYQFIRKAEIDFQRQLDELSRLCGWDMKQFLNQVLSYPQVLPRVRKLNGELHYTFREPTKPQPIGKGVKDELLSLANKITTKEKRLELIDLINQEQNLLFVSSELIQSNDLSPQEQEFARGLFAYFW